MKLTVSQHAGIGQIFAPAPREFPSIGGMCKALFDVAIAPVCLILRGLDLNDNFVTLKTAVKYAIFSMEEAACDEFRTTPPTPPYGIITSSQSVNGRLQYNWSAGGIGQILGDKTVAAFVDQLVASDETTPDGLGGTLNTWKTAKGNLPYAALLVQEEATVYLLAADEATAGNSRLVTANAGQSVAWE